MQSRLNKTKWAKLHKNKSFLRFPVTLEATRLHHLFKLQPSLPASSEMLGQKPPSVHLWQHPPCPPLSSDLLLSLNSVPLQPEQERCQSQDLHAMDPKVPKKIWLGLSSQARGMNMEVPCTTHTKQFIFDHCFC